jgi:hypothetical protein
MGTTFLIALGLGFTFYKFYQDMGGIVSTYTRSNLFLESENVAFFIGRQLEDSISSATLRAEYPFSARNALPPPYNVPFIRENLGGAEVPLKDTFVGRDAEGKIILVTTKLKQNLVVEIHNLEESLLSVIGKAAQHTSYILNGRGDLIFTNSSQITPGNVRSRKLVQTFIKEPINHAQVNIRSSDQEVFGAFHLVPHSNLYFFTEIPIQDAFWPLRDKFKEYSILLSGAVVFFFCTILAVMTLLKHRLMNQFMSTTPVHEKPSRWKEVYEVERAKAIFDRRRMLK